MKKALGNYVGVGILGGTAGLVVSHYTANPMLPLLGGFIAGFVWLFAAAFFRGVKS